VTLYFITAAERDAYPIKIGYTDETPLRRLASLQTGNPERLVVLASCPGTRDSERLWQNIFVEERMIGEWFKRTSRLMDAIRDAVADARKAAKSEFKRLQKIEAALRDRQLPLAA
jgi:hypothetical protein